MRLRYISMWVATKECWEGVLIHFNLLKDSISFSHMPSVQHNVMCEVNYTFKMIAIVFQKSISIAGHENHQCSC